jgi:hypothetical protein
VVLYLLEGKCVLVLNWASRRKDVLGGGDCATVLRTRSLGTRRRRVVHLTLREVAPEYNIGGWVRHALSVKAGNLLACQVTTKFSRKSQHDVVS